MKKQLSDIEYCCRECGITGSALTGLKKYGSPSKKLSFDLSTWTERICPVCRELKDTTEVRDFYYPDFKLITKFLNVFRKKS